MSKGCLVFAFNNEKINYIKQAESLAVRAKKFLNLHTTLVTDINIQNDLFDKIIVIEDNSYTVKKTYRNGNESERLSFKNSSRVLSYDLTPYDETIVLDSDTLVTENIDYWWPFLSNYDLFSGSTIQ